MASITCSTRRFVMGHINTGLASGGRVILRAFSTQQRPRTAAVEKAFYRLLFFAEPPDTPGPVNPFECTGFSVEVRSPHSLDLTKPPDANAEVWRHPVNYGPCQDLADAARDAGAEILRYQSARNPAGGACLAVLTCAAFAETSPKDRQTWWVGMNASRAYAIREFPPARIEFGRETLASDPRIAAITLRE
jgi:RES domain